MYSGQEKYGNNSGKDVILNIKLKWRESERDKKVIQIAGFHVYRISITTLCYQSLCNPCKNPINHCRQLYSVVSKTSPWQ